MCASRILGMFCLCALMFALVVAGVDGNLGEGEHCWSGLRDFLAMKLACLHVISLFNTMNALF